MSTLEVGTTPPVRRRPDVGWTELAVALLWYVALSIAVSIALGAAGLLANTALLVAAVAVATLGAVGLALAVRVRSPPCSVCAAPAAGGCSPGSPPVSACTWWPRRSCSPGCT